MSGARAKRPHAAGAESARENRKTAVPRLRFKGCEGEWKCRKFESCFSLGISRNTYSRAELSEIGTVRNIHYGDVLIKYGSVLDVCSTKIPFVANPHFQVGVKNRLQDGDVVMADTAEDETAGKVVEIQNTQDAAVVAGLHTIVLRPTEEFQRGFLGYYLNSAFHRQLLAVMQGTKVLSINKSSLSSMFVESPSKREQLNLGKFFERFDFSLNSCEREISSLRQLKRAMLVKMFPRPGQRVPEIRFKGFKGEWEEKRLGEIAEFNPCCSLPDDFEYVDLESVIGTEMMAHRTEYRDTAPSRAQRLAQIGDLFFQTVRPYQKNNYLFELDTSRPYVFSTGYAQLRPRCNGYFLMSAMQNEYFLATVLQNCTGSSYPAISDKNLSLLSILTPALPEQRKIAAFFRNLDRLIGAAEKKVAKLRQVKASLLERMFV